LEQTLRREKLSGEDAVGWRGFADDTDRSSDDDRLDACPALRCLPISASATPQPTPTAPVRHIRGGSYFCESNRYFLFVTLDPISFRIIAIRADRLQDCKSIQVFADMIESICGAHTECRRLLTVTLCFNVDACSPR